MAYQPPAPAVTHIISTWAMDRSINLLRTAVPWLHAHGMSGGRSRTLTDADVDTLARRVLAKPSVLLNWKGHLEKATLSLLELMASGRRTYDHSTAR